MKRLSVIIFFSTALLLLIFLATIRLLAQGKTIPLEDKENYSIMFQTEEANTPTQVPTQVPTPKPTEQPTEAPVEKILDISDLDNITKKYDDISLYYENLESGYTYTYNTEIVYFAASVIKAPYALYVYNLAENEKADLSSVIEYTSEDYRGGTGVIKNMKAGTVFTMNDLLKYSIRNSDNIALRLLIKKYGINGFKEFIEEIEGNPELIKTVSGADMTVNEAGLFAKEIYKYIESENNYGKQFKTDLMSTTNPMIISDYRIARKYGWAKNSFHDMAIVYADSPFILVIMTKRDDGTSNDLAMFKEVSYVFQEFNDKNF